jgi:hypothetical protein
VLIHCDWLRSLFLPFLTVVLTLGIPMAEETTPNAEPQKPPAKAKAVTTDGEAAAKPPAKAKKEKPPAIEDKPFNEFIEQYFTPALKDALAKKGVSGIELSFVQDKLPIEGSNSTEKYWQIVGNWQQKHRQFNLYFLNGDIAGQKAFSYGLNGKPPSTLESFMIDERKVNLDLLLLYTLQRLNGQKWFGDN